MFDLILKYYLLEKGLSILFNGLNNNLGHKGTIKVGDIVRVTFKDSDGSLGTFRKSRVLELSNSHMMLDTPTTEWRLNLLNSEQRETSLIWKMQRNTCKLLYCEDEFEVWELNHAIPWYIDYKHISNLVVEKL